MNLETDLKSLNSKIIELKWVIDKFTVILLHFHLPLSLTDRTNRQLVGMEELWQIISTKLT